MNRNYGYYKYRKNNSLGSRLASSEVMGVQDMDSCGPACNSSDPMVLATYDPLL